MKKLSLSKLVYSLCSKGEKVVESEYFTAINYLIKDGHIVVISEKDGRLAIKLSAVKLFCEEMLEVAEVWSDINTGRCVMCDGQGSSCKKEKNDI